jgi:anti-sigma regulatory factor (Ser/Thr protein kinase)
MDTPAGQRTPGTRPRAGILGSITIPGIPEQVSGTRGFIARVLDRLPGVDRDAATLLTSELVTNAIQHTGSGAPGGTVTVVVIGVPGGVLVEVVDDGSAGNPVVKGDLYAAEGQGLFLVQQLATQWGYLRDDSGTTVWFHLAAGEPSEPGREMRNVHRLAASAASGASASAASAASAPAVAAVAAWTASSMPAQMPARSSSQVT